MNGNSFYPGYIHITNMGGSWYAEAYAEVIPANAGTAPNFRSNISVIQDGRELQFSPLLIKNEAGSSYYDKNWTRIGFGYVKLPVAGNSPSVQIYIGENTDAWWNGGSLNEVFRQTYKLP